MWHTKDGRWPFWPWALLCILAVVDTIWIALAPVSLSANSLPLIGLMVISASIFAFVADRYRKNSIIYVLGSGLAFATLAWPSLRLFNHLTMTLAMPWADDMLSTADVALGFDWLGYIGWLNANPKFFHAIEWTYAGLDHYSAFFFVLVALFPDRRERCFEFLALFIVSACLCMSVGAFFPAKAAMLHYLPDLSQYKWLLPSMGTYHIDHMEALRGQVAPILNIADIPGLVTFPSFHTAMGLLLIYVCRCNPIAFGVSLVVNLSMIVTTPLLGSHYFIDLVGGALAALITIAIVRQLYAYGNSAPSVPEHDVPGSLPAQPANI